MHDSTGMAYLLKLKLPALKVTQTRSHGGVVHSTIPRSWKERVADSGQDSGSGIHDNQDDNPDDVLCTDDSALAMSPKAFSHGPLEGEGSGSFDPIQTLPSLHEVREKAAVEGWSRIRNSLLKTTVEGNCMLPDQVCVLCGCEATHRCLHCAPWAYFCAQCFGDSHRKINIFHVGEIWEVYCGNCISVYPPFIPTIIFQGWDVQTSCVSKLYS